MKIVHLILTRRFAGSERYAVELANMQAETHDVSIVLFRHAAEDRADAVAPHVSEKVNIIYVSNFKPLAVWQARRAIRRLRPDVCHAHLSWGCRILAGISSGDAGVRVATLHIRYKAKQHQRLDGLIAIAPWQLSAIPEQSGQQVVQIDNWSFSRAPSSDARQQLRQSLNMLESATLFGTLGRLDESKGLDVVIQAFKRAAIPGAKLAIVGDGPARAELEKQADENIIFTGYTREPQNWLAAFDVFASAARSEPFGLVLLEAMHAGLPIIASASEGATHLAPHIGRPLVAVDDVDGFAEAFRQLAKEPLQRLTYDMKPFEPTVRCENILSFYRQLVER